MKLIVTGDDWLLRYLGVSEATPKIIERSTMKNINKTFTFAAFAALFAMTTQASESKRYEIELDGVASQADSIPVIVRGQDGPLGIVLVKPAHGGLIRFELDLPLDQPYCIKIPGFTSDASFIIVMASCLSVYGNSSLSRQSTQSCAAWSMAKLIWSACVR